MAINDHEKFCLIQEISMRERFFNLLGSKSNLNQIQLCRVCHLRQILLLHLAENNVFVTYIMYSLVRQAELSFTI